MPHSLEYTPLEKIDVAKPVDRIGWIAERCAGKQVLDLGAMDETAFAQNLSAASAQTDARIKTAKTDFVVIGPKDAYCAVDLVVNRPDFSKRPLRIDADFLDDDLIGVLCRIGVAAALPEESLYQPLDSYFNAPPAGQAQARFSTLALRLRTAGCAMERLNGE